MSEEKTKEGSTERSDGQSGRKGDGSTRTYSDKSWIGENKADIDQIRKGAEIPPRPSSKEDAKDKK